MKRVNHSILPKPHPRKMSIGVRSVHHTFYDLNIKPKRNSVNHSGFLPYAPGYGFAYAGAWDSSEAYSTTNDSTEQVKSRTLKKEK